MDDQQVAASVCKFSELPNNEYFVCVSALKNPRGAKVYKKAPIQGSKSNSVPVDLGIGSAGSRGRYHIDDDELVILICR